MSLTELTAISPVDGRYRGKVEELVPFASEFAIIKNRVMVEAEYLISLSETGIIRLSEEEKKTLQSSYINLTEEEAQKIKDIETSGVPGINNGKRTNHDVKSVELFMRDKYKGSSLEDRLEFFHLALTSEDVNNITYALMLKGGIENCLFPALVGLTGQITDMAEKYGQTSMLGRTHGQPAIPTIVGKELANFAHRLADEMGELERNVGNLRGKFNGAIGNHSAHVAAYPNVDWIEFGRSFVENFELRFNPVTTQIEPHDSFATTFQTIGRINTILLSFDQDMWRYISDDYFVQKAKEGEVGSSTMPQKVNPIDFENSEGNIAVANALLYGMANMLPISRLQRHLSDSTVQRNIGTALAYSLLAYKGTAAGLGKVSPNEQHLTDALNQHWEMLAEPIQVILKREGISGAYDLLKSVTRGRKMTQHDIFLFVRGLDVSDSVKQELQTLTPTNYLGKAPEITSFAVEDVRRRLDVWKETYPRDK